MSPPSGRLQKGALPPGGTARGAKGATTARVFVFAAVFWAFVLGLLALDWAYSVPHNRFDEPLPWQLGHEKGESAGHCAAPLK
jgi:hypothetical protein